MEFKIEVEDGFNLEKAICNHGFFMMPPNRWMPSTKSFRRPLRLADGCESVMVSISSSSPSTVLDQSHLLVHVDNATSLACLSESDIEAIKKQVIRMLRLTKKDEDDVRKFQEMHAEAKSVGFGRLFRSPDLFEDVIKTILLSHTTWERTLSMCRYLCELHSEMHKKDSVSPVKIQTKILSDYYCARKKDDANDVTIAKRRRTLKAATESSATTSRVNSKPLRNFPSSKELACLSEEFLKDRCVLGLRAKHIIELAKCVEDGTLKLGEFEEQAFDVTFSKKVRKKLSETKGLGPFSVANLMMCLGNYQDIPADSETIRHIREVHGIEHCKIATINKDVRLVYDKFKPYQCLAYWYEQIKSYEKKLGKKLSKLSPSSYHMVANGSYLSYKEREKEECGMAGKRMRTRSQCKCEVHH